MSRSNFGLIRMLILAALLPALPTIAAEIGTARGRPIEAGAFPRCECRRDADSRGQSGDPRAPRDLVSREDHQGRRLGAHAQRPSRRASKVERRGRGQRIKTHPLPDHRLNQLGRAMADRFDATNGQVLAGRFYQLKREGARALE
jgi:hypothetical protein